MKAVPILALSLLILPSTLFGQDGHCRYDQPISGSLGVDGAELVEVIARSGSLRVEGVSGLSEVRVGGVACASSQDWLEELRLRPGASPGSDRGRGRPSRPGRVARR